MTNKQEKSPATNEASNLNKNTLTNNKTFGNNLASALVKAQVELHNPDRNQTGYGYKYADLASILEQTKPVLKKHGLSITQLATDDGNGRVGVTTILMHESGEYVQSNLTLPIPEMKGANKTQAAGAAITYARRYAISAILNIAADEDTDASNRGKTNDGQSKPNYSNGKASKKQIGMINALASETETNRDKIKEYYKVKSLNDLTISQASETIKKLKEKGQVH